MFGLRRLKRENAILREALSWYANNANWRKRGTNPKGAPRTWQKSPTASDRGTRARIAIAQADGGEVTRPTVPAPLTATDTE